MNWLGAAYNPNPNLSLLRTFVSPNRVIFSISGLQERIGASGIWRPLSKISILTNSAREFVSQTNLRGISDAPVDSFLFRFSKSGYVAELVKLLFSYQRAPPRPQRFEVRITQTAFF